MAYDPNDPNQGSQQDVNQQYDADTQQVLSLNQLLRQDPQYLQWLQAHGAGKRDLSDQEKSDLMAYVRAHYGVPANMEIGDGGSVEPKDEHAKALWTLAAVAAVPLAAYGASVGVGALGSGASTGAAAGTGAAGASGAAATGAGAAAASTPFVGPVAGGAATAAATSPSLWSRIAAPLVTTGINAATNYLGTKAQIDAQQHASDVQAKYLQDALDWQKAQLVQRRGDLAPYMNSGSAATYKLDDLMGLKVPGGLTPPDPPPAHKDLGLPTTSTGPANNWSPSTPPSSVQPGTAATGNQGPVVQMRSPSGGIGWVPAAQVNAALAAGGQRV